MKWMVISCLLSFSVSSLAAERISCAPALSDVPEGRTIADYADFFAANKIIPVTEISVKFAEQFKNEFSKFPQSLHREMLSVGAKIHIMEGQGVTADPTWESSFILTFDGRPWSEVPGAGGSTAKEFAKAPTRVAINHLYDKHGSASMFLHEYGHNLDSIESFHGISRSQFWADLLASEPNAMTFLTDICGAYCTTNVEEGFAELLANFHGCQESRAQMEIEVPRIAEFFKRFKSTKNLDDIMSDDHETATVRTIDVKQDPIPQTGKSRPRGSVLGCRIVFGRRLCI